MSLNALDWSIILVYLAGMIALSSFLARGQKTDRDYYLGGNKTAPLPIALSTMATQCSTNSLLGAPAFVGFSLGGGLLWLQYELAVPLAMLARFELSKRYNTAPSTTSRAITDVAVMNSTVS